MTWEIGMVFIHDFTFEPLKKYVVKLPLFTIIHLRGYSRCDGAKIISGKDDGGLGADGIDFVLILAP